MIKVCIHKCVCMMLFIIGLLSPIGNLKCNQFEDPMSLQSIPKDFVIRWAFWKLCQFGYDPKPESEAAFLLPLTTNPQLLGFCPSEVKPGDRIFLKARYTHEFFREIVPKITVPFVIVSHGEFRDTFCEEYIMYLDEPKLIAWFGIHPCDTKHSKFYPIPLGAWAYMPNAADMIGNYPFFSKLRAMSKSKLLYMNFAEWTHPERKLLRDIFAECEYCTFNTRVPFGDYIEEMAQHKFVLSPRGLGPDCYRTWEALMVGSIPIVKSSYLDEMYEGLPVLIVDNWDEINEKMLLEKYEEMQTMQIDWERLSIEYWNRKIEHITNAYLRQQK